MHYGFRIVEDMIEGLNDYLDSKGFKSVMELMGKAVPTLQKWESLDLNYKRIARINYDKCVGCNLCALVCTVDDCISMVSITNGAEKMGWTDYQGKLARGEMEMIPPH